MDRPSPIMGPEDLADRLGEPDLRIFDVRWVLGTPGAGRAAYDTGHLPGAAFLDLDTDLATKTGDGGRHPLPDPVEFADRLVALGVADATTVVAYDDVGGSIASRLWWMLDDLGHRHASVLDGGIQAWAAAGLPITTEVAPARPASPGGLHLHPRWTKVVDRDEVAASLGGCVLLDARAGERYRGEIEPVDPVPGHIPTALSAPTVGNLDANGRFLAPDLLAARFTDMGATGSDRRVISTCGSGVTACHNALAMRIAGLPDPVLYAGSYSDWSTAGMPIAVGATPGGRPG